MDCELLYPLTVDLLRLVDLYAVYQLIQHTGRQLLRPCVFADGGNEHIRCHGLAAQLIHFRAERLDLFRQFLLFRLISAGHFGKAFIGQLARNIVLIDTLKQSIQFLVTGLQGCKLFFFQLTVKRHTLLGAAHHGLQEIILVMACKLCKPPDLTKHHLLQEIHTDIMRRGTSASVALIVGAVKILDIRIALIEMEVEIAAAIGAYQEAGEHIAFPVVGSALADFPPLLLDLFPYGTINDRLMHILENDPVFTVILDPLFVLVGFGIGLEVEDITAILLEGQFGG